MHFLTLICCSQFSERAAKADICLIGILYRIRWTKHPRSRHLDTSRGPSKSCSMVVVPKKILVKNRSCFNQVILIFQKYVKLTNPYQAIMQCTINHRITIVVKIRGRKRRKKVCRKILENDLACPYKRTFVYTRRHQSKSPPVFENHCIR